MLHTSEARFSRTQYSFKCHETGETIKVVEHTCDVYGFEGCVIVQQSDREGFELQKSRYAKGDKNVMFETLREAKKAARRYAVYHYDCVTAR
jgi:hypothetical protein